MKLNLGEKTNAAKAVGKRESLPYFQSWPPSDTFWIRFRASESLKEETVGKRNIAKAGKETRRESMQKVVESLKVPRAFRNFQRTFGFRDECLYYPHKTAASWVNTGSLTF